MGIPGTSGSVRRGKEGRKRGKEKGREKGEGRGERGERGEGRARSGRESRKEEHMAHYPDHNCLLMSTHTHTHNLLATSLATPGFPLSISIGTGMKERQL